MNRMLSLLGIALLVASPALASSNALEPKQMDWAFDGVFGRFDEPSIQRGMQVYKEVCSACHSLKRVPFRSLTEVGFSEAEVKSLAAGYQIHDGPNDKGDMFDRPGRPSDHFPSPYANDNAARASNGGALPPDQSLLIKSREDGPNYIYSLLTGYGQTPPADHAVPPGANYNPYFPGGNIKMPQPLHDNAVTYQDGTNATTDQEARDIVNFLQWAAEPEMQERKHMGIHVMLFLGIMTCFFYLVKKRVWSELH
jgi:ubiquinol-cytochrome c reductase cytochrome c1 subunit